MTKDEQLEALRKFAQAVMNHRFSGYMLDPAYIDKLAERYGLSEGMPLTQGYRKTALLTGEEPGIKEAVAQALENTKGTRARLAESEIFQL